MTFQIGATFIIIAAMFVLMLLNKCPLAVTMTLAGLAFWACGVIAPGKLYSNFGGSTIIFLIFMSIEVIALERSGLVDKFARFLFRGKVVEKERVAVFVLCVFSGIFTGFISNTALVVMLVPVIAGAAAKSNGRLSPKHLLLPVAVEATVGESISLIGGAPNLSVQGALEAAGVETLKFFSCAPLSIILVLITAIYFSTIGYKILVKSTADLEDPLANEEAAKGTTAEEVPAWKQIVTLVVFFGTIICLVFSVTDNQAIAIIGSLILWATGVLGVQDSLKSVDWNTMYTLNFCLVVAGAMNSSGAGQFIVDFVLEKLGDNATYFNIVLIMSLTFGLISQLMSNTATNAMAAPICIGLAQAIGVSPLAVCIPMMLMVNNAVTTPIGSPCMTVSLAGGYRPKDYLATGIPLLIILVPCTAIGALAIYGV